MTPEYFVTEDQITAAKANGWMVKDLNTAAAQVRGPNWILVSPLGVTTNHGWTERDAWEGLFILVDQRTAKPITALSPNPTIAKIIGERNRQDAKWGEQNHDAGKWSLILTEELGEVAKSQLEGDRANYMTELVQAAAVLVAWIECEMRKESQ